MIRESNTLTWQETAEQKKMMRRRERVRRRKRKVWRIRGLLLLLSCLLILGGVRHFRQNPIQRYAKANGISMDQYPEELLSLYERNNETETFVEEYPLKKDGEPEIDLSDLSSASEVPLRMIRMVVENAHKCGRWAGICGELGADLTLTEQFVRMGVDELSVAPSMILKLRKIVREMKAEE